MKTDSELETLLRTTLANRAATVTDAPPVPAELPARRRPAWLPALAAAAAVAIAIAGILVGIHLAKDNPPANHTPPPAPIRTTCRTTLPAAWRAAFANADAVAGNARTVTPLSIAPDGSVLGLQDDGPLPGSGRFLVRVIPGHQPDVVLDIPDPDHLTVAIAQEYEHWLLVGYSIDDRPAKGTIPGSTPQGLTKIEVMDLAAHDTHVLFDVAATDSPAGPVSNAAALFDGRAYWDQRGSYRAGHGAVRSYDLATGAFHTVYTGPIGYTEVTANGLGLQIGEHHRVIVPAQLPAQVEHAVTSDERSRLGTDGTAYAWIVSPRVLGWWAPGEKAPTYQKLPKALANQDVVDPPLVSGRFVVTSNSIVTDMRVGASAELPATAGQVTRPSFYLSRDGVLAGLGFTEADGHYIDGYWADAAMTVLRLDTTTLPPLTC